MTFLDASFGSGESRWFLIGKDIEEMSVELNPDVETKQNIIGETAVVDNGYQPSMTADPYYANPEDSIYPKIKEIAFNRLTGDACKTKILEVIVEDDAAEAHEAYIEDVVVKPQSYGGGTSGVNIPYDVHFDGNRKAGTVKIVDGVPTFTEAAGNEAAE